MRNVGLAIHNVANLRDHLKRYAKRSGVDKGLVDKEIKKSAALSIIIDLSNNDKHGYPPREPGFSGNYPQLKNISKGLLLKPNTLVTMNSEGKSHLQTEQGEANIVLTGDIVDETDTPLNRGTETADLNWCLKSAIEALEALLDKLGIRGTS